MKKFFLVLIGFLGMNSVAKAGDSDASIATDYRFAEISELSNRIDLTLIEAISIRNLCNPDEAPQIISDMSFEEKKELLNILNSPNLLEATMSVEWVLK